MILVKLQGGLGNQLFQYAAGRRLAEHNSVPLKLDISSFALQDKRMYELGNFAIQESFASPAEIAGFKQYEKKNTPGKTAFSFSRITDFVYNFLRADKTKYATEWSAGFNPEILTLTDPCYLDGYWHSEQYFKESENTIRKEFALKKPLSPYYQKIADTISKAPAAVALHVRRGDFASEKVTAALHLVCDPAYYARAVQCITKKVPNPVFFVFSDDIAWVKQHLTLPPSTVYVSPNQSSDQKNDEELITMSLCKHFIISNSSYSWWAAWLSSHPGKIVYSPKKWTTKAAMKDVPGLLPEAWIPYNEGSLS